ncbi:5-oxoproline transporter, DUF979 family subunit [Bacillus pacificus]
MNIITMDTIYYLLGIIVAFIAVRIAFDREHPNRFGSSLFWALFAVTFLFGNVIPSVLRWLYCTRYGCVSFTK